MTNQMELRKVRPLRRSALGLICGLVTVALLAGCALTQRSLDSEVRHRFLADEAVGQVTADFTKIVPGPWKRMVIVCGEPDYSVLKKVLGFDWEEGREVMNRFEYSNMVIFSSDSNVESYYAPGLDPFMEAEYFFTPCDPPGEMIRPIPVEVITIPRRDSQAISLDLSPGLAPRPVWYISKEERGRLLTLPG